MAHAILAVLLLGADPAPPAETFPALLQRLAANEATLADLYESADYTLTTHTDSLDGSGNVSKTSDVETRMYTRADGKPWQEIVRFVDAGKDITEEHQKKRD